MIARELINDSYPPLKPSDSGLKALKWMENFKLEQIPIVDGVKYIGLITEEDVLKLNSLEQPMANQSLILIQTSANGNQPIFQVVKIMSTDGLSVVPVVDDEKNYLGLVTLGDVMRYYRDSGVFEDANGVIVLEMKPHEYSLSKIAHLVEAEDARILSSYVTPDPAHEDITVTLKISQADLTRILASFNRFGYFVKEHYNQGELMDDLKSRYDSLIKYLDI